MGRWIIQARVGAKPGPEAGIAIGPILFIIAILAVLIGALAAGDNGVGSATFPESSAVRADATTIVEQGNNLQSAMDRVLANGVEPADIKVVADVAGLSAKDRASALFAPSGGGLVDLKPPASAVPASGGQWYFVLNASLAGVGTQTGEYVAVLPISNAEMCLAINAIIFGQKSLQTRVRTIPTLKSPPILAAPADGNPVAPPGNSFSTLGATAGAGGSSRNSGISGSPQACVAAGGNFYYYQLLIAN